MRYGEILTSSLKALKSNKARSFLTMLGVIIGVFSVVTLVALGKGLQNYIVDQFESLGTDVIFLAPGKVNLADDPAKAFTNNKLEEKHMDLIKRYAANSVGAISPSYRVGKSIEYKNMSYYATFVGVSSEVNAIFNLQLVDGRHFSKNEVKSKAKVAVIGATLKEEFFANVNPIGKKLSIEGDRYEIIGILEKKNQDFDDNVIVPYTTLEEVLDLENFSGMAIKIAEGVDAKLATRQVELALLRDLDEDEFTVLSAEDVLASFNNILNILTAALGGIAGISLIVGGIGIMNIMLVSVTERTKEIGLRKAVGAKPFDIGMQFVAEAIILSVFGGLIGLLLGYGVTLIAQRWFAAEITLGAVVLAFTFSVIVGIIFGTYPAMNAAKKDPIEALRYE